MHTAERPYICSQCDKYFTNFRSIFWKRWREVGMGYQSVLQKHVINITKSSKTLVSMNAYVLSLSLSSMCGLSPVYITNYHMACDFNIFCAKLALIWYIECVPSYFVMWLHGYCIFSVYFLVCLLRLLFWEEVISEDIRGNIQRKKDFVHYNLLNI